MWFQILNHHKIGNGVIMNIFKRVLAHIYVFAVFLYYSASENNIEIEKLPYKIYPEVNEEKPNLPSPFFDDNNKEFVIAVTKENKYAIIPITLSNDRDICKQLIVDTTDFPHLANTGLHSDDELNQTESITGWPLNKITELGRPNGLSQAGFMAENENILSVLKGDNQLVRQMGLTHPQLAKPIFHVLNMMDMDLALNRWNMAKHRWDNIQYFYYNNQTVYVDVGDTKGGQKSIFNDNIEGAFHINLWREFDNSETTFLNEHYKHLTIQEQEKVKTLLSNMNSGEMEPQYIMRYGFYEGHTYWRTDPIAIAFIFGFKSLKELDKIFDGNLYEILTTHFTK